MSEIYSNQRKSSSYKNGIMVQLSWIVILCLFRAVSVQGFTPPSVTVKQYQQYNGAGFSVGKYVPVANCGNVPRYIPSHFSMVGSDEDGEDEKASRRGIVLQKFNRFGRNLVSFKKNKVYRKDGRGMRVALAVAVSSFLGLQKAPMAYAAVSPARPRDVVVKKHVVKKAVRTEVKQRISEKRKPVDSPHKKSVAEVSKVAKTKAVVLEKAATLSSKGSKLLEKVKESEMLDKVVDTMKKPNVQKAVIPSSIALTTIVSGSILIKKRKQKKVDFVDLEDLESDQEVFEEVLGKFTEQSTIVKEEDGAEVSEETSSNGGLEESVEADLNDVNSFYESPVEELVSGTINNDTTPITILLDYGNMTNDGERQFFERALASPDEDNRKLMGKGELSEEESEIASEVKAVENVLFEEFSRAQQRRWRKEAEEYEARLAEMERKGAQVQTTDEDVAVNGNVKIDVGETELELSFDQFMEDMNDPNAIQSVEAAVIDEKEEKTAKLASAFLTLGAASVAIEFLSFVDVLVATPLVFLGAKNLAENYLKDRTED